MNSSLASQIAEVLTGPTFAGRTSALRHSGTIEGPLDYTVAVPVRNEEALLPRALDALLAAMRSSPARGGLVFVINDTTDNSAMIIRRTLQKAQVAFAIVEMSFASEIRNAAHARRLALDLAWCCAPGGVLLTTDADSCVGPNWIASRWSHIASGYDLVCEDVRLDEQELALLPTRVAAVGEAERAYFEASNRLWRLWTGEPADCFAYRASGASLAIRSDAYRKIGGLPTPSIGEDSALCEAVLAAGLKVGMPNDVETRTSARLLSRAQGGCGACLKSRASADDPLCDPVLIPLALLREWAFLANRSENQNRYAILKSLRASAAPSPLPYSQVLIELQKARDTERELSMVHA
ncbi:glycosyltransferase [Qipengyuania spongiae]|uniref:Glycosyltransferase family 2 protein n=1 Tax=Qipengyuania spongiae TaxID=2909673 RepID=A0ABY5T2V6_9SPHN|nr:glycosyltransferase family 2 protein [Qipengyuania spongiae]UVI39663.1 glycosyltransferase family 2 protein [Qipengyuania spongiae]